jgi:hypothetical protein
MNPIESGGLNRDAKTSALTWRGDDSRRFGDASVVIGDTISDTVDTKGSVYACVNACGRQL